jgi:hypothetical protein
MPVNLNSRTYNLPCQSIDFSMHLTAVCHLSITLHIPTYPLCILCIPQCLSVYLRYWVVIAGAPEIPGCHCEHGEAIPNDALGDRGWSLRPLKASHL